MQSVELVVVVEVPDGTPAADIQEWAEFYLCVRCTMKGTNELTDQDLVAERVSVL